MSLAVGGPVEQMSAQNAIGGNMMYPQSQLQTDMYSNPMVQRPIPNDVIQSGIDAPVNSYTGEPRFAPGGLTMGAGKSKEPTTDTKYTYDPNTMQYTQTTTKTPAVASNSMQDAIRGFYAPVFGGGLGGASFMGVPYNKLGGQQAAKP